MGRGLSWALFPLWLLDRADGRGEGGTLLSCRVQMCWVLKCRPGQRGRLLHSTMVTPKPASFQDPTLGDWDTSCTFLCLS